MGEQTLLDSVLWHVRSWDEIKRTSLFTLSNYANVFLLVIFVAIAILQTRSKIVRLLCLHPSSTAAILVYPLILPCLILTCICSQKASNVAQNIGGLDAPGFPPIEELENFDWKEIEPLKLRPFKPKYHLTMGEFLTGSRLCFAPTDKVLSGRDST